MLSGGSVFFLYFDFKTMLKSCVYDMYTVSKFVLTGSWDNKIDDNDNNGHNDTTI